MSNKKERLDECCILVFCGIIILWYVGWFTRKEGISNEI